MIPLASLALAGCLAVSPGSDHILAGDLVPAFPAFAGVAADIPVALAPAPGVQRVFRLPELGRLAARWNIMPAPESGLCFERKVAPLDPGRLLEAMRRQLPEARVEIIEFSRSPAPEGEIEFPLSGLHQIPAGGYWSGSVRYAGSRRFLIWARVKVLISVTRVVAAADLRSGSVIGAAQLRLETRDEFPAAEAFATSIEGVAGGRLRRPVPAGTALHQSWLDVPWAIERNDTVRVEVWSGGAHLEFEARAEASGTVGQSIPVRNPESGKRFLARVEGKGRVTVGKGSL